MAARMNINIPDELSDRLGQHRDRINFSRVCTQALDDEVTHVEQEVSRLEGLKEEVGEMDSLIARLKEQKEGTVKQWYSEGVEEAKKWIQHWNSSYGEISQWVQTARKMESASYEELRSDPPLPQDILDEWDLLRKDERYQEEVPSDEHLVAAFAEGFYTGLIEIWEIIEAKI